ncbi:16S rRNA (guanine(1207)-N(2))-methyltransferase RsmC [Vibrio sp. CK2-1]|uniref:16S rRNA (guanine(1207)-N(2))-methyltransferase RsmC n=1 Tax=Vibrio sp. CK2-1 TaxID=2912249 RepID=UPI001F024360|nr:16S rRNA (guanine(1207)-N(2))-methyltransferase RsmC [Vibrio sp. CK2-1]MCF7355180.1 16S rRNA (guanine(1207)-N(2))-methyltransferase RsmC [Vibrio sp. CK2-1]
MSTYTAPSQIAQRQLEYFHGKHVLIAGEAEDLFCLELAKHCESVSIFTTHYGYHKQFEKTANIQSYFGAQLEAETKADMLLLYWPKAKTEAEYLLAMLMDKLGVDTEICVVGENRSGVKSIEKMFSQYGIIKKYDSARRCSFYWGQCQTPAKPFTLSEWYKSYPITIGQDTLTIKSLPGVFSHGEFDKGSELLLATLPKLKGRVLDFGCGAGVIGSVMATRNPNISLEMCDISALAIESSKATLQANGLKGTVFASDIYSDITGKYDYLISNPPFHSGLDTNYSAAENLLSQAPNYISHAGKMIIVANNFLKYPPIIQKAFGECVTLDKNTKFSIYSAQK